MNIQTVKIVVPGVLLSVKFDGYKKDELARVFEQWGDVAYLEDFFSENFEDLSGDFYGVDSVEDAVFDTIRCADDFGGLIDSHARGLEGKNLNDLFKPYDNKSIEVVRERSKARGEEPKSWLRLYAIRLGDNLYVVTGGAIKLTKNMDREHLQIEHRKMDLVKSFFKILQINSEEDYGFIDLE